MEATGNARWFELLVERLGRQLWIGDPAKIRASYVRKQKTDKRWWGKLQIPRLRFGMTETLRDDRKGRVDWK